MNSVQAALLRVAQLDPATAGKLLVWLDKHNAAPLAKKEKPRGAKAMIGFARRAGQSPKSTAEWMRELREGE